jgi:HAE1 family hydrophobic/amphiphilic exporter-1
VKSVSSLAGYEILTEGTGSNAGTCLINLKDWNDRKQSVVEIMAELEEKSKSIPGANIISTASGTWLWSCRRI